MHLSATIVWRVLREAGYHKTKPTRKPRLTQKMREERYKWALDHKDWTPEDWKNVIWTDETSVVLGHRRGGYKVWRRPEEKEIKSCIHGRWKGYSEFMFWGCYTYRARAPNEAVRPTSHPNIITLKSSQLQRVITPPPRTRFKKRLKKSNRVKMENNYRTEKLQKKPPILPPPGVDRTTLSRRHQGLQRPRDKEQRERQLHNPQQELELVRYIERCTKRGLPPTQEMVANFASAVAKWEVSESWVTRFLSHHADELTTKWSARIDGYRHEADSRERYEWYFDLLHSKMREFELDERNTYNMDEKGFFVGIASRSKRVFSKTVWQSKERTEAIKDGNREWVTLIACVCASGEALPPALIYQGSCGIQSSWVDDVEVGKHQIFFFNSPTGWSNNDLGFAWHEQVFNRHTTAKARRRWRLLILDGHSSYVTADFIDFCDINRILSSMGEGIVGNGQQSSEKP
jgi:hypothetical protein